MTCEHLREELFLRRITGSASYKAWRHMLGTDDALDECTFSILSRQQFSRDAKQLCKRHNRSLAHFGSILAHCEKTGGVVEGQVKCSHGRVDGELKAKITASDVLTIGSVANVTGDVEYGLLEVASGGMIHGMVTHCDQTQPSITCDEASSDEQNGGLETISEGIVAVDKAEVIAKSPEKSGGETNRGVVVLAEVQKDGLE